MLLHLQNIILKMIARGDPLKPTMDRLCLEIEAIITGTVCSVLTLDESRRIHPLSAPNLPAEYCAGFDGALIGPNLGSCGTAAFRGEPVSVLDVRSDPLWANVDVSRLPPELVACWSSPILDVRRQVVGTFAFYFRENRGPTEIEEQAVAACAQLCAIAIERDAPENRAPSARIHRYLDRPRESSGIQQSDGISPAGEIGRLGTASDRSR
jgi:GAF domain-containing protein